MRDGYTNLNNGAFGTTCAAAQARQRELDYACEADANTWYRGGYGPLLVNIRTRLSKFVNCQPQSLVMVEDASWGANAVLRSMALALKMKPGDKILLMNVAYPMIVNVCNWLADELGLEVVTANLPSPVTSNDQVLRILEDTIKANPGIRMSSLDWMSSYPAILLPCKEMVALMRKHGIFTFIDAAHTLGHIKMDIEDMQPDALVANAHKWMYSPKAGAILYVDPKWQSKIQPAVIGSENANAKDFAGRFAYTGTRSYNAMIAVDAAMDYRDTLGNDAIMKYLKQLAWEGAAACMKAWGMTVETGLIVPSPDMNAGIIDVILPTQNGSKVRAAADGLLEKYDTYIQCGVYEGSHYVRLSAQIYLELSDFELFATRFLELAA
jgi:selenocysteine lyase/cysteine desulfurase